MTTLKHCPRCGPEGKAVIDDLGPDTTMYYVICEKCGLQTLWHSTKEKAAEDWNTRPYEDELTAERDRFRERCEELEARLDLGTGNMYDVVCAENEKLREGMLRAEDEREEDDAALKKLLDDFQVTVTITLKTLPDNEEIAEYCFIDDVDDSRGILQQREMYTCYRDFVMAQPVPFKPTIYDLAHFGLVNGITIDQEKYDELMRGKADDDDDVETLPDNEESDCEPDD